MTAGPSNLDFGNVSVGQTKDLTLSVVNSGSAPLTVSSIVSSNARFAVTTPAAPFNVAAGATQSVNVRFSPTAAGALSGTLTVSGNDPARPSIAINLTGTGTAATSRDVTLSVDSGEFDTVLGFPNGTATAFFLNRLTPPSYPATLKSVQIVFIDREDGLPLGTPITIVSATNPSGSPILSLTGAGSINLTQSSVVALDALINFTVPQRTITSGDFVVGFMVQNPAGIYPAELDRGSASQQRSYISSDGVNFVQLDAIPDLGGNLGIRAVVTLGSGSNDSANSDTLVRILPLSNLVKRR
jgi:hypothetical protein